MKVIDVIQTLQKFPEDEDVSILYPEDNYGEDIGVAIAEIAYITGSKSIKTGVYIKLG